VRAQRWSVPTQVLDAGGWGVSFAPVCVFRSTMLRHRSGGTFAHNEECDPAPNSWRTLQPMLTTRHGAVAGPINGVAYVVGGGPNSGSSYRNLNEAFVLPAP